MKVVRDKNGNIKIIEDIETALDKFKASVKSIKDDIKELEKENMELRNTDDFYSRLNVFDKIELLHKLNKDLGNYPLVTLTESEDKLLKQFTHDHYLSCKKGKNHGAIGYDEYIYSIAGTGLGTIVKVKCPVCGEEIDITDTSKF